MEGAKRRGSARSAKGSTAAGNLRRYCFYFLWQFELRTPGIDFAKWNATASLTNEFQVLANVSTSGKSRTSATNLSSNGERLSFRQTRAKGKGKFKSVTGSKTTPCGHRQRVALLTNATPSLHDTRLRMVASFIAS